MPQVNRRLVIAGLGSVAALPLLGRAAMAQGEPTPLYDRDGGVVEVDGPLIADVIVRQEGWTEAWQAHASAVRDGAPWRRGSADE